MTFEIGRRFSVKFVTELLISQLAKRCRVPATTLRFYEDAGLLPASRAPNGYRVYGEEAVARLEFISAAKRLGLPLEEIAGLLAVWADGSCAQVRDDLRPRLARRITEAEQRARELAAFTAVLRTACEHLDSLPDREGKCDQECGFLIPVTAAASQPGSPQSAAGDEDGRWRGAPVACSLDGQAMDDRADQWLDLVGDAERQAIPDGIRLTVPASRAAAVAGLAVAEQECCPFFDFRIHLAGQRLHLEIRAPEGASGIFAEMFASR